MNDWISTNDAYPDEGVKVLAYNAATGNYCVGNYSKMFDKWRAPGSPMVTHWMPLPQRPEGGRKMTNTEEVSDNGD